MYAVIHTHTHTYLHGCIVIVSADHVENKSHERSVTMTSCGFANFEDGVYTYARIC